MTKQCKYFDPTCPCQDGLACHYEDSGDTKGWDPRHVLLAEIGRLQSENSIFIKANAELGATNIELRAMLEMAKGAK